MHSLLAVAPTPSQTQGSAQDATITGAAIVVFVVLMVALAFLLAWLGKYRGRRRPEPRPSDKPFRPT
jgi:hypothetical protein